MNLVEITNQIKKYIHELLGPAVASKTDNDASLIETRLIDSITTLQMVAYIEDNFSIEIGAHEVISENFDSVNKIANFIYLKKIS